MLVPFKNYKKVDGKYVFTRFIPKGLKLEVGKGDNVESDSLVASGEITSIRARIDVLVALRVDPSEVKKYLRCLNGERVTRGDVIASKKKTLVRKENNITASVSGVIDLSEVHLGFIKILDVAQVCNVNSGIDGKIVNIIKNKQIGILSDVLKVKPFQIYGHDVQSELYYIDTKRAGEIGENLKGNVIFLSDFNLKDEKLLRRFATIGIRGIILSSVDAKIREKIDEQGLWGMTVCIIDGFGKLKVENQLDKLFQMNDGRLCFINAVNQTLILTNYDKRIFSTETMKMCVVKAKSGLAVQVFEDESWGAYGKIDTIEGDIVKVKLENGGMIEADKLNIIAV